MNLSRSIAWVVSYCDLGYLLGALLCAGLTQGCVTDVDLALAKNEPVVVIEGNVTDEPYDRAFWKKISPENVGNYVRLTYSDPVNDNPYDTFTPDGQFNLRDLARYIRNARVTISDDFGTIDTLREDSTGNRPFAGYYTSDRLICQAGRNYHLDVWIGNAHYSADAFMEPVPRLDSVGVEYIKRPIDKFSGYAPLFYFRKSTEKTQYYLTKIGGVITTTGWEGQPYPFFNQSSNSRIWDYAVVSSEYLPEYVNGLSIPIGSTSSTYYVGSLYEEDEYTRGGYAGCLFSLTKEAYEYYSVLIRSLKNDGGAYSPTPASPPSNIKGGAIGFFNASSGSIKPFRVKK